MEAFLHMKTRIFGTALLLWAIGCGEEETPPAESGEEATEAEAPAEATEAEAPPAANGSPAGDEPAQGSKTGGPEALAQSEAGTQEENSNDVPSEEECKAALYSMSEFAERIGIKPPKKRERKDFMTQCAGWPKSAVSCLADAQESQDVLNCMKPISEMEMKREIKEAKKTLPTRKRRGGGASSLVPKEVKGTGGAAARRMKSFKKAVGKE